MSITRMTPKHFKLRAIVGSILLALSFTAPSLYAANADAKNQQPDTSKWKCRFCAFDYGWSGSLDLGLIGVSGANYKYGEYTGFYDRGLYPLADGGASYRNKDGYYFDANGGRLGLDSRWINVRGGRQGLYKLHGSFRQTPQFLYDTSRTPFLGAGSTNQTLPSDWVYAGSTDRMTALPGALAAKGISNQRRSFDLGASVTPPKTHWDFVFDVRHDKRTGTGMTGANFLTTTSQLLAPIDYRTDQIEATVGYSRNTWQLRGGYYGSFFHDGSPTLQWNNPFQTIVPGSNVGRMSLAPDNSFNQFFVNGGWQVLRSTRVSASLAYGRARQNDAFIPSTINTQLSVPVLPASSLNGDVRTGNYIFRVTSSPWRHVTFAGEYLIDRRDNRTPQYAYPQVNTDAFVAANQINVPYSFNRHIGKLRGSLRVTPRLRLQAGVSQNRYSRTMYASLRTRTDGVWAELTSSIGSMINLSARYTESRRTLDNYHLVVPVLPANNPLLRDFDIANRTRNQWRGTVSFAPRGDFGLDLVVQHNTDDYRDSPIGLTSDKDSSATLNANWRPKDKLDLDAFATREFIRYNQSGSKGYPIPVWNGSNRAVVDTFGFSSRWREVIPGLDLGASYSFSYSRQRIAIITGTPEVPFPDNTVNYGAVKLWSSYRINKRMTVHVQYAYERLSSAAWALDGVEPDTISNVLALGVQSPRYRVNVFGASFRYEF